MKAIEVAISNTNAVGDDLFRTLVVDDSSGPVLIILRMLLLLLLLLLLAVDIGWNNEAEEFLTQSNQSPEGYVA